jgi:hypothetical protein
MAVADNSSGPPANDLDRLDALGLTLNHVLERLDRVASRERTTRHLTWGLATSLVLDIALTIIVSVLTIMAISQGYTLHASQLNSCANGNETRAAQRTLWSYVITTTEKTSHANQSTLNSFEQFVDRTFANVNCSKLYP